MANARLRAGCTIALLASAAQFAGTGDASARKGKAKRKRKQLPAVLVETPVGIQGRGSAGTSDVHVAFAIAERRSRRVRIEMQYGWDVNGDGRIADGTDPNLPSEYFPATTGWSTARVEPRGRHRGATFTTTPDGVAHAVDWRSEADVGRTWFPTIRFARYADGRPIPDPNNPGSFLFADVEAGVRVRVRAHRVPRRKGSSPWAYSYAFALRNRLAPTARIVGPQPVDFENDVVPFDWIAYSEESEDLDGDGVLDPYGIEDRNRNGVLDPALVRIRFDYHPFSIGQIERGGDYNVQDILWFPCTHAEGFGDPADGVVATGALTGGRRYTFAWLVAPDVGHMRYATGDYLIRAIPVDDRGIEGPPAYGELTIPPAPGGE